MLHSTTSTLQGNEIREYLGIVTGEAILGANIFRDIFGAIRDIVGGRAAAYEKELSKARRIAMQEMNQKAGEMGAHAIIGIDLDYEVLGKTGSMMMVSVCGTAVKLR